MSWQERSLLEEAEMIIDAKPEFIMIGASGLWTLQSPEIFRDLSLPTLKRITRMAKEAGIPTMLHSCGKQRDMIDILARRLTWIVSIHLNHRRWATVIWLSSSKHMEIDLPSSATSIQPT